MSSSRRIVWNTLATYGRSVLAVALSLFSSRWVLGALGQSDFGLFAMVGSLIVFITFLNGVMSVSAARHFSFSIGRGDTEDVVRWFNASLSLHVALPAALILMGWPVGEYAIRHVLVVPPDRMAACLFVFRLSLASAFTGMLSVPFIAMFSAKQRIAEQAFWGMMQTLGIFALAWSLDRIGRDALRTYAAGMVGLTMAWHLVQVVRARFLFPECRVDRRFWFDRPRLRGITSFASWSLVGSLSRMLSLQAPSILLNLFFGTKANAAYGIANQVANQTTSLTTAMMSAMSPEITASEGRGDRSRVFDLALRSCKFGTLLAMLFAIPLLLEMDYVLRLWLRNPPAYAATLCQWMLMGLLAEKLTLGHMMAVNASGRIATYQLVVGSLNVLSVPLAWYFLKIGWPPPGVGVALFIASVASATGRVYFAHRLIGLPVWRWAKGVLLPCAVLGFGSAAAAFAPVHFLAPSPLRLLAAAGCGIGMLAMGGWLVGLDGPEKAFLLRQAKKMLSRMSPRAQNGTDAI